jgi:hypothetical protein
VFDGLARTIVEFADDFIDSTYDIVADADTPEDYFDICARPIPAYLILTDAPFYLPS